MEEKKQAQAEQVQTKLSYEELEKVAVQLQQRCAMLEDRLRSIDMASVRMNFLLRVLEVKNGFSEDFLTKCGKEVEEMLTIEEPEETEAKQ